MKLLNVMITVILFITFSCKQSRQNRSTVKTAKGTIVATNQDLTHPLRLHNFDKCTFDDQCQALSASEIQEKIKIFTHNMPIRLARTEKFATEIKGQKATLAKIAQEIESIQGKNKLSSLYTKTISNPFLTDHTQIDQQFVGPDSEILSALRLMAADMKEFEVAIAEAHSENIKQALIAQKNNAYYRAKYRANQDKTGIAIKIDHQYGLKKDRVRLSAMLQNLAKVDDRYRNENYTSLKTRGDRINLYDLFPTLPAMEIHLIADEALLRDMVFGTNRNGNGLKIQLTRVGFEDEPSRFSPELQDNTLLLKYATDTQVNLVTLWVGVHTGKFSKTRRKASHANDIETLLRKSFGNS